jgi:hypothetical protein
MRFVKNIIGCFLPDLQVFATSAIRGIRFLQVCVPGPKLGTLNDAAASGSGSGFHTYNS